MNYKGIKLHLTETGVEVFATWTEISPTAFCADVKEAMDWVDSGGRLETTLEAKDRAAHNAQLDVVERRQSVARRRWFDDHWDPANAV